jgi:hypothetical protein
LDAIIGAAEELGSDGKGAGGLQGYMKFLGRTDTKTFGMLLRAAIPTQINATVEPQVFRTEAEIVAEMRARGIPHQRFFPPQYADDDDVSEATGPVIDLEPEK